MEAGVRKSAIHNAATLLVLGVSAYLVVAAIVVVPELQEDTATAESDIAKLTTTLQSDQYQLQPNEAAFFTEDPLASLGPLIDGPSERLRTVSRDVVDKIEVGVTEIGSQRERTRLEHRNDVESWTGKVLRARTQALTTFERNARRKGNVERDQHYEEVLDWYEHHLREAQREVNECVRASEMADNDSRAWASVVSRRIERGDANPIRQLQFPRWQLALDECDDRWDFTAVPPRQPLGGRLGPFGPIARWLLQTESLSLVSVVGLLGFGLLGAAASTVIRERGSAAAAEGRIVSSLASVTIRGLSAALVVFLAVKGGLTVFATGSPEPSPYVLMLTCLVAAVFSEPVWEGARVYLTTLIGRWTGETNDQDDAPPTKPVEASKPAAPA